MHSHVIPRRVVEAIAERPEAFLARIEGRGDDRRLVHDAGYAYPLLAEFYDPAAKLASMDRKGIGVAVISPAPTMFNYTWSDPDRALEVARLVNDGVAELVAAAPARLRGMATLPMQHPDAALAELERVVKVHGFRGVEIGTSIEGRQIADPLYRPILRRAQDLGVFVFAHPYYVGVKAGLERYYLTNLVGNPLDTAVMAAHLMFGGVLDELPDLKVCLAHGGGFLPYQIGRLAHGHAVRAEVRELSRSAPRDLLRRFYYDDLVFEPLAIRYLVDLVGADRVAIGTDSPFDMGDEHPIRTLEAVPRLDDEERRMLCSGTALSLLGET